MKEYTLKHKKLLYFPLIGMIYIIFIGFKQGKLTNLKNVNAYEAFLSIYIQTFSLAGALLFLLIKLIF